MSTGTWGTQSTLSNQVPGVESWHPEEQHAGQDVQKVKECQGQHQPEQNKISLFKSLNVLKGEVRENMTFLFCELQKMKLEQIHQMQ